MLYSFIAWYEEGILMSNEKIKADKVNPYEKIFDDANRALQQSGSKDFVEKLDPYKEEQSDNDQQIPFPYGGRGSSSYNFG